MGIIIRFPLSVGLSRSIERGGESILDNFDLNLLQLVIAHISSVEEPRRSCKVHSNLRGNPKREKTVEFFSYIKNKCQLVQ